MARLLYERCMRIEHTPRKNTLVPDGERAEKGVEPKRMVAEGAMDVPHAEEKRPESPMPEKRMVPDAVEEKRVQRIVHEGVMEEGKTEKMRREKRGYGRE